MIMQQPGTAGSKAVTVVTQTKKEGLIASIAEIFGHTMTEQKTVDVAPQALEPVVQGRVMDVAVRDYTIPVRTPDLEKLSLESGSETQVLPPYFNLLSSQPEEGRPGGRNLNGGIADVPRAFNYESGVSRRGSATQELARSAEAEVRTIADGGHAWGAVNDASWEAPKASWDYDLAA